MRKHIIPWKLIWNLAVGMMTCHSNYHVTWMIRQRDNTMHGRNPIKSFLKSFAVFCIELHWLVLQLCFSPPVRWGLLDFMSVSSPPPPSPSSPPPRLPSPCPVAILCVQCGMSDLNCDPASSVWRAGPQPRSCEFSVASRTPTAILWVQCGVPDLKYCVRKFVRKNDRRYVRKNDRRYVRRNVKKKCQKICQKECQKICQKICQKECQKICQKECRKICQKEW